MDRQVIHNKSTRLQQLLSFAEYYNRVQQQQWERIRADNHPQRQCQKYRGMYAYGALPPYNYIAGEGESLSWEEILFYAQEHGWNGIVVTLYQQPKAPILAAEQLMHRLMEAIFYDLHCDLMVSESRVYFNGIPVPSYLIVVDTSANMVRGLRAIIAGDLLWRLFILTPKVFGIPYQFNVPRFESSYMVNIRRARPPCRIPQVCLHDNMQDILAPDWALVYFLKDILPEDSMGRLLTGKNFVSSPLRFHYQATIGGFNHHQLFRVIEGPNQLAELTRDHRGEQGHSQKGREYAEVLQSDLNFDQWARALANLVHNAVQDPNLLTSGRQLTLLERQQLGVPNSGELVELETENQINGLFIDGAIIARLESYQPNYRRLVSRASYELVGNQYRLLREDGQLPEAPQSAGNIPIPEFRPNRIPTPPPENQPEHTPQYHTPYRGGPQILQEQIVPPTANQPPGMFPQLPRYTGGSTEIAIQDLTGDTPTTLRNFAVLLENRARDIERQSTAGQMEDVTYAQYPPQANVQVDVDAIVNQVNERTQSYFINQYEAFINRRLTERHQANLDAIVEAVERRTRGATSDAMRAVVPHMVDIISKDQEAAIKSILTKSEENRQAIAKAETKITMVSNLMSGLAADVRQSLSRSWTQPPTAGTMTTTPASSVGTVPTFITEENYKQMGVTADDTNRIARNTSAVLGIMKDIFQTQLGPGHKQSQRQADTIIADIADLKQYVYDQAKAIIVERDTYRDDLHKHRELVAANLANINSYFKYLQNLVEMQSEIGRQFLLTDVQGTLDTIQRGLRNTLPEVFDRHAQLFQTFAVSQRSAYITELQAILKSELATVDISPREQSFIPMLANPFRPSEGPTTGKYQKGFGQSGNVTLDQDQSQQQNQDQQLTQSELDRNKLYEKLSLEKTYESGLPQEWTGTWAAQQLEALQEPHVRTISQQQAYDQAEIHRKLADALENVSNRQSQDPLQKDEYRLKLKMAEEAERKAFMEQERLSEHELAADQNLGVSSRHHDLQLPQRDRIIGDTPNPPEVLTDNQSRALRRSKSVPEIQNGNTLKQMIQSGFSDINTHLDVSAQQQTEQNQQVMDDLSNIIDRLNALEMGSSQSGRTSSKRRAQSQLTSEQVQKQRTDPMVGPRGSFPARHTRQADQLREQQQKVLEEQRRRDHHKDQSDRTDYQDPTSDP